MYRIILAKFKPSPPANGGPNIKVENAEDEEGIGTIPDDPGVKAEPEEKHGITVNTTNVKAEAEEGESKSHSPLTVARAS